MNIEAWEIGASSDGKSLGKEKRFCMGNQVSPKFSRKHP